MVVVPGLKRVSSEDDVCFCVSVTLNCGLVYQVGCETFSVERVLGLCSTVVEFLCLSCGFFEYGFVVRGNLTRLKARVCTETEHKRRVAYSMVSHEKALHN